MQIQTSTAAITTGNPGIRPESPRIGGGARGNPRGTASAAGDFAQNLSVPARSAGLPEAREAIAANFSEDTRPTRTLPRGSLVDLTI